MGGGGVGKQGPDGGGSAGGMRPRMGVGVCLGQNGGQSAHRHKWGGGGRMGGRGHAEARIGVGAHRARMGV